MIRKSAVRCALVALFACCAVRDGHAQTIMDTIPASLPAKYREPIASVEKQVRAAMSRINTDIDAFNARCIGVTPASSSYSGCVEYQRDLERRMQGIELSKQQFNTALRGAIAEWNSQRVVASGSTAPSLPQPADLRDAVAEPPQKPKATEKKRSTSSGRSTALGDLSSIVRTSAEAAATGDTHAAAAGFDTKSELPADCGAVGLPGDCKTMTVPGQRSFVIPPNVLKMPEYKQLETERVKLASDHALLEQKLKLSRLQKGDPATNEGKRQVEESKLKQEIFNNERKQHAISIKVGDLVRQDLSVNFGSKKKTPAKEPPPPKK